MNLPIKSLTSTCACSECGKADKEGRPRPDCTCHRCNMWSKGIKPPPYPADMDHARAQADGTYLTNNPTRMKKSEAQVAAVATRAQKRAESQQGQASNPLEGLD